MSKCSILISGAGPSGLVLALALRRNGVDVRIIDKELGVRLGERGAGVSPRSLELHKVLGTFDDVNRAGGPIPVRREYDPLDGHKVVSEYDMVPTNEVTVGIPYANAVMLGQNHHERILKAHLEAAGTKVEFGSELRSFTQTGDRVSVEIVRHVDGKEVVEKSEVAYLIGCDGAHSVVRKTLGLSFLGETKEDREMLIGDIKVKSEPREYWERWGDMSKKVIVTRPSSQDADILSFIVAGKIDIQKMLANPDLVRDEFYEMSGRQDIVLGEVVWISKYRPNIRMVDKLRVGRVFIAGDAAHCHSPTGGQGLNSSIQDSFNLAWKLALVQKGYAPASLLDTYNEERLPVIAEMLNKTTELLKHAFDQKVGRDASENKIRKDMTQLGVNYRGSSIVYNEGASVAPAAPAPALGSGYNKESETAAQPGDRAPEAPGLLDASAHAHAQAAAAAALSLFGIFSPAAHTVLIFADADSDAPVLRGLSELLRRQPENAVRGVLVVSPDSQSQGSLAAAAASAGLFERVVVDRDGHARAGYGVTLGGEEGVVVVVVRPDGFVGARARSAAGVEQYFKGVFAAE